MRTKKNRLPSECTPEEYKALVRANWSEAEFLAEVIKLAKAHGWKTAHFRPAQTTSGRWITAVQGDGKGFPDLVLLRRERMLVAELKVGANGSTPEQREWLICFGDVPSITVYLWWPEQWPEIEEVLR